MNILFLTAGAGTMYCGSCLQDNALAAGLIRRGHEVVLLPLYTPTLTDEANVSHERVFMGGISIYLQQHVPLLRHRPRFIDRLLDAPWLVRLAARRSTAVDPGHLGALTVSVLEGAEGLHAREIDKLVDWLRAEPPFDVIHLPNSLLIGLARPLREALGRPVVCTLQGEDLFLRGLPQPYRQRAIDLIRAAAREVDAFVAVSEFYAPLMSDWLNIPARRITVIPIGVTADDFSPGRPSSDVFTVGYLARVAPEKGLHVLAEAYESFRARPGAPRSRLVAAGWAGAGHRDYLARIRARLDRAGLGHEFEYRGAVSRAEKIALLQELHVASVPCTQDEPKGLSVLEALASAVPVVQPRRGAFPEMLARTGGGLLVAPDDPAALADALAGLAADRERAARLGREGSEGVRRHYTVDRMVERTLELYTRLTGATVESARFA